MNLQAKKFNLVANFSEFKPFTIKELLQRVEESENDFKNGNFRTQDELEQLSED